MLFYSRVTCYKKLIRNDENFVIGCECTHACAPMSSLSSSMFLFISSSFRCIHPLISEPRHILPLLACTVMSSSIALVCSLPLHPIHSFIHSFHSFHHITIINISFRILSLVNMPYCSQENSSLTLLLSTCNGEVCSPPSLQEDLYLSM